MNRLQIKRANAKAGAAAFIAAEIAAAWGPAHTWNAYLDRKAAEDAEYAAIPAVTNETVDDMLAYFDAIPAK